jgi:hypothetical protein
MNMNRMPGITLAVFVMGYIDVVSRFVAWANAGGGLVLKLCYLGVVIAANCRQKWARVVWSLWLVLGIGVSLVGVRNNSDVTMLTLLVLCGVILPISLLIFLWHPSTTDWFQRV